MPALEYTVLRCCERLSMNPAEFHAATYEQQILWLAYELRRMTNPE